MGARTSWEITTDNETSLYLYSHWGGETKAQDTRRAIEMAMPRWLDESYCARIIVSQIIGTNWNEEYGYGLLTGKSGSQPFEEEYAPCRIDIANRLIKIGFYFGTFEDFIETTFGIYEVMERENA